MSNQELASKARACRDFCLNEAFKKVQHQEKLEAKHAPAGTDAFDRPFIAPPEVVDFITRMATAANHFDQIVSGP